MQFFLYLRVRTSAHLRSPINQLHSQRLFRHALRLWGLALKIGSAEGFYRLPLRRLSDMSVPTVVAALNPMIVATTDNGTPASSIRVQPVCLRS